METNIYKRAIEKWGVDSQLCMVAEECSELSIAVLKIMRKKNNSTLNDVAGEIADVEIMIAQLEEIFSGSFPGGGAREYIDFIKKKKLKRLENRIGWE